MTSDDLAVLVNQYGIRPAKFLDAGNQLRYLLTAMGSGISRIWR